MASAPNTNNNTHRIRPSTFLFPETADYYEPSYSSTASPTGLQMLSGTGSPCGEGKFCRELLEDEYSEIEYSDMDGEDDMIYDTPPYYHYGDELQQHHQAHSQQSYHSYQQQSSPHQHARPLAFAGKGDYTSLPSSTSSSYPSLQDQEQVEEALRASLSTLLAAGPRPRFRQRRNRPRKIYTVDSRSQRSSPIIPASPTHVYYSTTTSPHLRSSNPDSILGDLSPHYFHDSITPSSRDYDSASSDSEATRKKAYRRGILSTGQPTRDHYFDIESTALNSDDPAFSGSTTPLLSPPHFQGPDPVANKVLQGPSALLATRYMSWSVKAQSILDHAARKTSYKISDGQISSSSSRSSSPHSSPSTSGASTPSRIRRKRCPIPEPHQGFFSRALDQRSLASHVSVSRVGMGGTLCPPLHVGLRTGMLIRGSSPLRPTGSSPPPHSPTSPTRQYTFKSVGGGSGILTNRNDNICGAEEKSQQGGTSSDDKENKRWYGQEIGLNLWQTTLGAAALLGTGFGSGMAKKVQLHPKELSKENKENAT
ncbi:hypothetical protein BGZ46_004323 [Entomortierella lignicola]|nr:hypothetical protein BGZ46_004323 [Entomortierella lignicola]